MATHGATGGHSYQGARADGNAVAHFGDKIYNTSDTPKVDLLAALAPVAEAKWNSAKSERRHEQCLAGTRTRVLSLIQAWTKSDSAHGIFWLAGMAGTGKSTIAMTVCQDLADRGCALGSFFFERGGGATATTARLLCTLTYQLAVACENFKKEVAKVVEVDPTILHLSMSSQLAKLLLEPLKILKQDGSNSSRTVLVLDALDECDDLKDVQLLLSLLSEMNDLHEFGLKILVTSRPDWPIRSIFQATNGIIHEELQLHKEDRARTDSDIKLYIQHKLARVAEDRHIPQPWPTDNDLETLVVLSAGLFIFAATCCRYLNAPRNVSPVKRLATVCDDSPHKALLTNELDRMYSIILGGAFAGEYDDEELDEAKQQCREVLTAIILSFEILSSRTLSQLTQISECDVKSTIDSMPAVIDQDDTGDIQVLHESLRDYLMSVDRCRGTNLFIDYKQGHQHMAKQCLLAMKKMLSENICHVKFLDSRVSTVSPNLLIPYIPDSLRYACQYWLRHVLESAELPHDDGDIHTFLKTYFLEFITVISIFGQLPGCISSISRLASLTTNGSPALSAYLDDARNFLEAYESGICKYPLQIYVYSAYFAPDRLRTQSRLVSEISRSLLFKSQDKKQCASYRLSVDCEGEVRRLGICADGSKVAVITKIRERHVAMSRLSIIDTVTGAQRILLNDYLDGACDLGVTLSSTGEVAASSYDQGTMGAFRRLQDLYRASRREARSQNQATIEVLSKKLRSRGPNTLRVWNTTTGSCLCSFDQQRFEALSSDGAAIATRGKSDQRLHFWDTATRGHIMELDRKACTAIVNGKALVTSWSGEVQLWDIQTCALLMEWPASGDYKLSSSGTFTFHTSGENLVMYNIADGSERLIPIASFRPEDSMHSRPWRNAIRDVHVSRDESKISFRFGPPHMEEVSELRILELWPTLDHSPNAKYVSSVDEVNFLCFTDDGRIACCGTSGRITHVKSIATGTERGLIPSIDGSGRSLYAICPYLPIAAISSGGSDIRILDIAVDSTAVLWHLSPIVLVVLSSNGKLLAAVSGDAQLRLWRVESGTDVRSINVPFGVPRRLEISNDLRFLAGVSHTLRRGRKTAVVWLWERSQDLIQELLALDDDDKATPDIDFSPFSTLLRAGTHVWETESRKLLMKDAETKFHLTRNVIPELLWDAPVDARTEFLRTSSSISYADNWIWIGNERSVWLPEGHRPKSIDAVAWSEPLQTLCIGSREGKLIFIRKTSAGPFLDPPAEGGHPTPTLRGMNQDQRLPRKADQKARKGLNPRRAQTSRTRD